MPKDQIIDFVFKKFQSSCCVTDDLQKMWLWRALEQQGPSAVPFFLFFRSLPPVRSGFSPEGRNLRAFPFILNWPELLSTEGGGLCFLRGGIGLLHPAACGVLCLCNLMHLEKAIVGQSKR